MGRRRLSFRFPTIPQRIFDKISKPIRQQIAIYNGSQSQMIKLEEEIIELKLDIKEKQQQLNEVRRRCEKILVENKQLTDDFDLRIYPTYIGKGNGSWNLNLKYKGRNKSIYVGTDEYVKTIMKTDDFVIERNGGKVPKRISNQFIKDNLPNLIADELWDRIVEEPNKNILSETLTFNDFYNG